MAAGPETIKRACINFFGAARAAGLRCAAARGCGAGPAACGTARDSGDAARNLDSLSAQIDVEAGALRHWTTEEPPASAATPP
ncbi:hypothetical protein ACWEWQ_35750, partial [Streptomyces sp. NPDC003832]